MAQSQEPSSAGAAIVRMPAGGGAGSWAVSLAVTVAVLGVLGVLQSIPLPWLDRETLRAFYGGMVGPGARARVGLLSLGINPVISGFVLVEIASVMFPKWRPLRKTASGRAVLNRWAALATYFAAAIQAWGLATWLENIPYNGFPVVLRPGIWFQLVCISTILGATALVMAAAAAITRHGVGNGYAVLVLLDLWRDAAGPVFNVHGFYKAGLLHANGLNWIAMAVLGMVGCSVLLLRWRNATPDKGPKVRVRFPTSGVVAVYAAAALFRAAGAVQTATRGGGSWTWAAQPLFVRLGVIAVATVLFARVLVPPTAVAQAASRRADTPTLDDAVLAATRSAWNTATFATVAFMVVALYLLERIERIQALDLGLATVLVPLLVAVAVLADIVQEAAMRTANGGLVQVAAFQTVWEADSAASQLEHRNVPVLIRGVHFRSMYHFFAPYAPVDLMVPRHAAAEATALLEDPCPVHDAAPEHQGPPLDV